MAVVLGQTLKRVGRVQKQYQNVLDVRERVLGARKDDRRSARRKPKQARHANAWRSTRRIEFESVSFAYGEHRILDKVSFSIPAGVITCLVGDSGSGKTTIADLVIGLIHAASRRRFASTGTI